MRVIGVLAVSLLLIMTGCKKPQCENGVQDQDETGVDCGGLNCSPCISCFDGVQNQGETGVDCGGPCKPCDLNWTQIKTGGQNLNAVDFFGGTGYAVGDAGTVLKSTDSGMTWTTLTAVTTESLREVHVRDASHMYAVGDNDIVVTSTDGNTLNAFTTGRSEDWKDVYFTDIGTGVICGSGMRIMRTTDGGQNWTLIFSKPSSQFSFQTMSFVNDLDGYAFGGIEFRQTFDAGQNWTSIQGFERSADFKDFRDLYYKTTSDAYCTTEDGLFLFVPGASTQPGGKFWVNKQIDISGGKLDFLEDMGLYAGRNNSKSQGKVLISFDGGVRWSEQNVNPAYQYTDGEILSEHVMVVVGSQGVIIRRDK